VRAPDGGPDEDMYLAVYDMSSPNGRDGDALRTADDPERIRGLDFGQASGETRLFVCYVIYSSNDQRLEERLAECRSRTPRKGDGSDGVLGISVVSEAPLFPERPLYVANQLRSAFLDWSSISAAALPPGTVAIVRPEQAQLRKIVEVVGRFRERSVVRVLSGAGNKDELQIASDDTLLRLPEDWEAHWSDWFALIAQGDTIPDDPDASPPVLYTPERRAEILAQFKARPPGLPFDGVRSDLSEQDLSNWGWNLCHRSLYSDASIRIDQIMASCAGQRLVVACKAEDDDRLKVAATASRDVVFDETESGLTREHEGLQWYFNEEAFGFAPAGVEVELNSCDITDGPSRLCWHLEGGGLSPGYKCGNREMSPGAEENKQHQRLIFDVPY